MSYEQAASMAGKAAYASAGATVIAGITLNEWAIIVGICATIITVILTWYYKQKHLDLARERLFDMDDDGE